MSEESQEVFLDAESENNLIQRILEAIKGKTGRIDLLEDVEPDEAAELHEAVGGLIESHVTEREQAQREQQKSDVEEAVEEVVEQPREGLTTIFESMYGKKREKPAQEETPTPTQADLDEAADAVTTDPHVSWKVLLESLFRQKKQD